jgi:hypothetical protein
MKQFQFPLFFVVDIHGATSNEVRKVCEWFNVLTSDTNLRTPPNSPFEGNHRFYGLVNVQAMRSVYMSGGERPAITRANSFYVDHITTSGGVWVNDDQFTYQCYGSFDEPSTRRRTYWFVDDSEYTESSDYKCFMKADSDYVLTACQFINNVVGKTADALFLNTAGDELVIQQLERNKVVPVYWLDDDKVQQLKSLSEDMYNQYMNDGYVLVNTSCVEQYNFGYVLKHTNTVRIGNGLPMPAEVFTYFVDNGMLVEVERNILNNVFTQDDTRRPYLFEDHSR